MEHARIRGRQQYLVPFVGLPVASVAVATGAFKIGGGSASQAVVGGLLIGTSAYALGFAIVQVLLRGRLTKSERIALSLWLLTVGLAEGIASFRYPDAPFPAFCVMVGAPPLLALVGGAVVRPRGRWTETLLLAVLGAAAGTVAYYVGVVYSGECAGPTQGRCLGLFAAGVPVLFLGATPVMTAFAMLGKQLGRTASRRTDL